MILEIRQPRPPLDRFVESITYFEGFQPDHTRERLVPDAGVHIIVDLTDTPKRLYDRRDPARSTSFRGAWISGMQHEWITIEAAPDASSAVIRFRPGGAYPFVGFGLEGLNDTVGELPDILDAAASALRDRILEQPTVEGRFAAIEHWLLERGRDRLEGHPAIDYLTGRLFAPGGVRIADVVAEVGYSQRHVLGMFRRWVGLSPKAYTRVRRFRQTIESVAAGVRGDRIATPTTRPIPLDGASEPDWADLALAFGYFDQSHLIRDFREYAGMTPTAYFRRYRGLDNYFPVDGP